MQFLMKHLLLPLLIVLLMSVAASAQVRDKRLCQVYGTFYVEQEKQMADFSVFVEETEGFADLSVFLEENQLYADQSGLWFFVDQPGLADYRIYLERDKNRADFCIFYTNTRSFAGCR